MIWGFVICGLLAILAIIVICGAARYDKIRPTSYGPQALDDDYEL